MKFQEIKELLEKYYQAETDLKEENLLRDYFLHQQVPNELQAERDQFIFFSGLEEERPKAVGLEDKIMENLFAEPPTIPLPKRNVGPIIGRIITAVAAGLLLIFTVNSLQDSFSDGLDAPNLGAAIVSDDCGSMETCYQYADAALKTLSLALSDLPTQNFSSQSGSISLFEPDNTESQNISIEKAMMNRFSKSDSFPTHFRELIKAVEQIRVTQDNTQQLDMHIASIKENAGLLTLKESTNPVFFLYSLDDPNSSPRLIFYQPTRGMVEVIGNVDLSKLKGYNNM